MKKPIYVIIILLILTGIIFAQPQVQNSPMTEELESAIKDKFQLAKTWIECPEYNFLGRLHYSFSDSHSVYFMSRVDWQEKTVLLSVTKALKNGEWQVELCLPTESWNYRELKKFSVREDKSGQIYQARTTGEVTSDYGNYVSLVLKPTQFLANATAYLAGNNSEVVKIEFRNPDSRFASIYEPGAYKSHPIGFMWMTRSNDTTFATFKWSDMKEGFRCKTLDWIWLESESGEPYFGNYRDGKFVILKTRSTLPDFIACAHEDHEELWPKFDPEKSVFASTYELFPWNFNGGYQDVELDPSISKKILNFYEWGKTRKPYKYSRNTGEKLVALTAFAVPFAYGCAEEDATLIISSFLFSGFVQWGYNKLTGERDRRVKQYQAYENKFKQIK